MNLTRPAPATPGRQTPSGPPPALRRIVRIVSDSTGRTPEEVWALAAAAAVAGATVAVVRAVLWALDFATRFDIGRNQAGRSSG